MTTPTTPTTATTATTWHVRVDMPPAGDLDEDRALAIIDELGDLRAGLIPGDDALAVTVIVAAPTLRKAIAAALERVEAVVGGKALGVEAVTLEEIERRLVKPDIPDLVASADIAAMLGVTPQRARQLATAPGFPPAVAETKASGPLRVRAAVEEWAKHRRRTGGRPRKTAEQ